MKLIKLTRQPYGETVMINPSYITAMEETGDGTDIHILMNASYKVKESIDKVMKKIDNNGWSAIYNVSTSQDNAQ